jgi:penicillin-binding protein 1A
MGPLFQGANVDGGTFPAQIWGQYMKAAAGKFCGKFEKPKKPFKTKVFKGKRANQAPVAPRYTPEELAAQARQAEQQVKRDQGRIKPAPPAGAPNTGGNGYNPDAYNPDVYDNTPDQEVEPGTGAEPPAP